MSVPAIMDVREKGGALAAAAATTPAICTSRAMHSLHMSISSSV